DGRHAAVRRAIGTLIGACHPFSARGKAFERDMSGWLACTPLSREGSGASRSAQRAHSPLTPASTRLNVDSAWGPREAGQRGLGRVDQPMGGRSGGPLARVAAEAVRGGVGMAPAFACAAEAASTNTPGCGPGAQ